MQKKNSNKAGYILIVEDDRGISELEAQQLESMGKEIRRAYTVEETAAALKRELPDLMLLDYMLGNQNALTMLEKLKREGIELPPFLIVTGRGDEGVAVETMKAGAQDYLVKDSYFLKNLVPATAKALEKAEILKELKRTRRLAESEKQKYKELFTAAPVPYLALSATGKIAEVNKAWLKTFGYAEEQVKGLWAGEFIAEELRDKFSAAFSDFLKKGSVEDLELRLRTGKSGTRTVLFSGRAVKGQDGRLERAQCAFTDITERLETERKLKVLARMHSLLARVNKVAAKERSAENLLREICSALVTIGGATMAWAGSFDRESGVIRPLCAAGLSGRHMEDVQAVTGGPATAYGGCAAAAKAGKLIRINDLATEAAAAGWRDKALALGCRAASVLPLCSGKKNCYLLCFYSPAAGQISKEELELFTEIRDDVSRALEGIEAEERRAQAQAALERTSDYLARMLDANPVVLFSLKNDGAAYPCIWVSGSAVRILGYDAGEVLAPGWLAEHLHPQDKAAAAEAQARFGQPGKAEADYRFRRKDGSYIWVKAQFIIPKGSGDITGSWTDITRLKECESRFEELLDALPDGALVRRGSEIKFANRTLAALAGAQSGAALRGTQAEDLLDKSSRAGFLAALRDADSSWARTKPLLVTLRGREAAAQVEVWGIPAVFAGERCGLLFFRPKP